MPIARLPARRRFVVQPGPDRYTSHPIDSREQRGVHVGPAGIISGHFPNMASSQPTLECRNVHQFRDDPPATLIGEVTLKRANREHRLQSSQVTLDGTVQARLARGESNQQRSVNSTSRDCQPRQTTYRAKIGHESAQ